MPSGVNLLLPFVLALVWFQIVNAQIGYGGAIFSGSYCVGSRNNTFKTITLPAVPLSYAAVFTHINGTLSGSSSSGTLWGGNLTNTNYIGIQVRNSTNLPVIPTPSDSSLSWAGINSKFAWYSRVGAGSKDKTLVFPISWALAAATTYKVGFGEDLDDVSESDNSNNIMCFNLTIYKSVPYPPTMTVTTPSYGQTFTFTLTAPSTNGGSPVTYYNIYNYDNFFMQTNATFTTNFFIGGQLYKFSARACNIYGCSISASSYVSILPGRSTSYSGTTATTYNSLVCKPILSPTFTIGATIAIAMMKSYSYSSAANTTTTPFTITGYVNNVKVLQVTDQPTLSVAARTIDLSSLNVTVTAGSKVYFNISSPACFIARLRTDLLMYSSSLIVMARTNAYAPIITSVTQPAGQVITFAWTPASWNGGYAIAHYRLYNGTAHIATFASTATVGNFSSSIIRSGSFFSFALYSIGATSTAFSAPASYTYTSLSVPGAPTIIEALSYMSNSTRVAFRAPTSNGGAPIFSYYLYRNGVLAATVTSVTNITISNLLNGVTYNLTMTANNMVGSSALSTAASVVPAKIPAAPSLKSCTSIINTQVSCTIQPSSDNGGLTISSYKIYINGVLNTISTSTSFTIKGLTDTTYSLTVSATNFLGESSKSSASIIYQDRQSVIAATLTDLSSQRNYSTPYVPNSATAPLFTVTFFARVAAIDTSRIRVLFALSRGFGDKNPWIQIKQNSNIIQFKMNVATPDGIETKNGVTWGTWFHIAAVCNGTALKLYLNGALESTYVSSTSYTWNTFTGKFLSISNTWSNTTYAAVGASSFMQQLFFYNRELTASEVVSHASWYPSSPLSVSATSLENKKSTVSFLSPLYIGVSNVTLYNVTSSPGGFFNTGASSPIVVSGLTNGVNYTFTVTTTTSMGTSAASVSSNIALPASTSQPPTSLSATCDASGSCYVYFSPPSNNNGAAVTGYKLISSSGQNITDYSSPLFIQGLTVGNTYLFTVVAINMFGESEGASINAVVSAIPSEPQNIAASSNEDSQSTVSFSPPTFTGGLTILYYTITSSPGDIVATGSSSPITIDGLTNGVSYTFTVTATNSAGTSQPSRSINSATPAAPPSPPFNVAAISYRNRTTMVSFSSPTSSGGASVSGYRLYVSSSVSSWDIYVDASPVTVHGLTNGVNYTIVVAAGNSAGWSTQSVPVYALPATLPDAPSIASSSLAHTGNYAVFNFVPPVNNGGSAISYYTLYSSGALVAARIIGTVYEVPVTPGKFHYFTVSATNMAGTSTNSTVFPLGAGVNVTYSLVGISAARKMITYSIYSDVITVLRPGILVEASLTSDGGSNNAMVLNIIINGISTQVSTQTGSSYVKRNIGLSHLNLNVSVGTTVQFFYSAVVNTRTFNASVYSVNGVDRLAMACNILSSAGAPDAPTISNVTTNTAATTATVVFIPNFNGGLSVTTYTLYNNGALVSTCASSPCTASVTAGTIYSFALTATNAIGASSLSAASVLYAGSNVVYDTSDGTEVKKLTYGFSRSLNFTVSRAGTLLSASLTADIGTNTAALLYVKINGVSTLVSSQTGSLYQLRIIDLSSLGRTVNAGDVIEFMYGSSNSSRYVNVLSTPSGFMAISCTILSPTFTPSAPNNVVATVVSEGVTTLKFTAPFTSGGLSITKYAVLINGVVSSFESTTVSVISVTNLVSGNSYTLSVVAFNSLGQGTASVDVPARPVFVPGSPNITSITSNALGTSATLAFTISSYTGGSAISSYRLYNYGTLYASSITSSPYTFNITAGSINSFTLRAVNSIGESADSSMVNVDAGIMYPYSTDGSTASTKAIYNLVNSATITVLRPGSLVDVNFTADIGGNTVAYLHVYVNGIKYELASQTTGSLQQRVASIRSWNKVVNIGDTIYFSYGPGVSTKFVNAVVDSLNRLVVSCNIMSSASTPGVPTNVRASTNSDGRVIVSFSAPASNGALSISTYRVYVDSTSTSFTSNGVSSIDVTGLTYGQRYAISVTAANSLGEGDKSSAVYVTPAAIPDAPLVSSVVPRQADNTATVSFTAPSTCSGSTLTGYKIWVNNTQQNVTIGVSSTFVTLSNIRVGSTYTIFMRTSNALGDSLPSLSNTFTSLFAPYAPQNVAATSNMNGRTVVTFTAPSNNGGLPVTSYKVLINGVLSEFVLNSGTPSPITVTGLVNGQRYSISVVCSNAVGDSPASTSAVAAPATVPDAPTIVSAVTTLDKRGIVTISAPSSNGGASISLYRIYQNGVNVVNLTTSFVASVSGLSFGSTYTYTATAVSPAGESAASSPVSVLCSNVPNTPINVVATNNEDSKTTISFTSAGNGGMSITRYIVYLSGAVTNFTCEGETAVSIVVTGLMNGRQYSATLIAVNGMGSSAQSVTVYFKPAAPPSVPTSVTASSFLNAQTYITLKTPTSNGGITISGYVVYLDGVAQATRYTTTAFFLNNLVNGRTYILTISAYNTAAEGIQSDPITFTPATKPNAPPSINGTSNENEKTTLTYSAPYNGGSDILYYKVYMNGAATLFQSTSGVPEPIVVSGLSNGVTYYFQVSAINGAGEGSRSATVTVIPDTLPGAPGGTTCRGGMDRSTTVYYTAPDNYRATTITGYKVFVNSVLYYTQSRGAWPYEITITGLTNGVTYDISVVAYNKAGDSPLSDGAFVTPSTTPGAPSITATNYENTQTTLKVTPPSSNGGTEVTRYTVYVNSRLYLTVDAADTANSILVSGLSNGVSYSLIISASNSAGEGARSAAVTAIPSGLPAAPTVVSAASFQDRQTTVTVNCNGNGGSAIQYYNLYLGGTLLGLTGKCGAATVITGLTNGNMYSVAATAVNLAGEGPVSVAVAFTPATVPSAVLDVEAENYLSKRTLVTFAEPISNGGAPITGYRIYVGATLRATVTAVVPVNIDGLTNGVWYSLTIKAVNGAGESVIASTAISFMPGAPPSSPTSVSAKASSIGQCTISFAAVTSYPPVLSYTIYLDGQATAFTIDTASSSTTSTIVTGLDSSTNYYLSVTATNAAGESSQSSSSVCKTASSTRANPPYGLSATVGNTFITIKYNAPRWVLVHYIKSYRIYLNGEPTNYIITGSSPSPVTLTGLTNGVRYAITATVTTISGESLQSSPIYATPATSPNAPTDLTTVNSLDRRTIITYSRPSWNGGASVSYYRIYVNKVLYRTSSSYDRAIGVYGLKNGIAYSITVTAVSSGGESVHSFASTCTPASTPLRPTISSATNDVGSSVITFSAGDNNGATITQFRLYINGRLSPYVSNGATASPITALDLAPSRWYYFHVSAVNAVGEGSLSNSVVIRTPAKPSAPYSLRCTNYQNAQSMISFYGSTNNGGSAVKSYKLYIDGTASTFTSTKSPITATGLTNGNAYYFSVTAINAVGESTLSTSVSCTPARAPDAPTLLDGTNYDNARTRITYMPADDDGGAQVSYFKVYVDGKLYHWHYWSWRWRFRWYWLYRGWFYRYYYTSYRSTTTNMFTVDLTSLTNGKNHTIQLRSVNAVGESPLSDPIYILPATYPNDAKVTSVKAVTSGSGQVVVYYNSPTWNGGAPCLSYRVWVNSRTSPYVYYGSEPSPITIVSGLITNTRYSFTVICENVVGNSKNRVTAYSYRYVAAVTAPNPPTSVKAQMASTTSIKITFIAPSYNGGSKITGYRLYVDNVATSTVSSAYAVPFLITNFAPGTTYSYQVTALNAIGESSKSVAATFTLAVAPSAPRSVSATNYRSNSTILTFLAPTSNGGATITVYKIYVNGKYANQNVTGPSASSVIVTGLINGNSYSVSLSAVNFVGESSQSSPAVCTPATVPDPVIVTKAPSYLDSQTTISFAKPASDGGARITEYRVYLNGIKSNLFINGSEPADIAISGLINGLQYTITIAAINAAGSSFKSNTGSSKLALPFGRKLLAAATSSVDTTIVVPAAIPSAPLSVSARSYMDSMTTLNFTYPSWDGGVAVTRYKVYINGALSNFILNQTAAGPLNVTGLTNGVLTSFYVTAVSPAGESGPSSVVSAIPATVPSAPFITAASLASAQTTLTFTGSSSNGGAAVQKYLVMIDNVLSSVTAASTATSVLVAGLVNSRNYSMQLIAVNAAGRSASSNKFFITPGSKPSSPSSINAVAKADGTVTLTFNTTLVRGDAPLYYWRVFVDGIVTNTTTTSPIVLSLVAGQHILSVAAYSGYGQSTLSPSVTVIVGDCADPKLPAAPTGLSATSYENEQITVTFTASVVSSSYSKPNYYQVYVDNVASSFSTSTSGATGTVVVTSLNNGQTYSIYVVAVSCAGISSIASTVTATPGVVPDAPTLLAASFTENGQTTLNFTTPSSNGGLAITQYKAVVNGVVSTFSVSGSQAQPLIVTGLTNGVTYTVAVKAISAAGSSVSSNTLSVTPGTSEGYYILPDAPVAIYAQSFLNGYAGLNFTVNPNSRAVVTTYRVYVNGQSTSFTSNKVDPITVTGLTNGVVYVVHITASNLAGESEPSPLVTVQPATIPSAPTNLKGYSNLDSQGLVSFSAPSNNGGSVVSIYRIYIDGKLSNITALGPFDSAAYITGLQNGQGYTITVSAVNGAGESAESAGVVVTPATIPSAPQNVVALARNQYAIIQFSAPYNGGSAITKYKAYVDGTVSVYFSTSSPLTIYGLVNQKQYAVYITAVNAVGESDVSEVVTVTPISVPGAPTNVTAYADTDGEILVNFAAPSYNGGADIDLYIAYVNGVATNYSTPGPTASTIVVSGQAKGRALSITVVASNAAGLSPASNATAVTINTIPDPPTIVSVTGISNGKITVYYTAPSVNGGAAVTGYKVYMNGALAATFTGSTTTPINVTGLLSQSYSVYMTCTNSIGESDVSDTVSTGPVSVPDAPTDVNVTSYQNTFTTVYFAAPSFNGYSTITKYVVYIDGIASNFQVSGSLAKPINVTGLENGESYAISVAAVNSIGTSALSTNATATPGTAPTAPLSVTAVSNQDSFTTVTFQSPAYDGNFTIYSYVVYLNGLESKFNTSGPDASSIVVTGLTNGQTYSIALVAMNAAGTSPKSNTAYARPATVPDAPTNVTATGIIGTTSTLTFLAPQDNGGLTISIYRIYINNENTMNVTSTSAITLTNLDITLSYSIYITCNNQVGESSASNIIALVAASVPGTPTDVSATSNDDSSSTVSFSAPDSDGYATILRYQLYIDGSLSSYQVLGATPQDIVVTNLINARTYAFKVSAVNAVGESALSTEVTATPMAVPSAPYNVSATSYVNTSTVISFNPSTSNGGAEISLYAAVINGQYTNYTSSSSPISVSGLTNGVNYTLSVVALNAVGYSLKSPSVSVVPGAICSAPRNVVATSYENTKTTITFSAPTETGGLGVTVYKLYMDDSETAYTLSGSASTLIFYVTGLNNGQSYTFNIVASNAAGDSIQSDDAIATPATKPSTPTELSASVTSDRSISLSFTYSSNDGGNSIKYYKLYADGVYNGLNTTSSPIIFKTTSFGQTIQYQLSAINSVGESSLSTAISFMLDGVPTAPTNVVATSNQNQQVTLTFTASSSNSGATITQYKVYVNGQLSSFVSNGASSGSVVVTGLSNGVTYTFAVSAVNSVGESALSSTVSATPATVPGVPINVAAASNLPSQTSVTFTSPGNNGGLAVTLYKVYLNGVATNYMGASSPITVTGLQNGQTYTITLTASNSVGESAQSASVTARPAGLPSSPSITFVELVGAGDVKLTFTPSTSDGSSSITKYVVYVNDVLSSFYASTSSTNVTVTGLSSGSIYRFALAAINAVGSSSLSNTAELSIAAPPESPTISSISNYQNHQTTLVFRAPASNGGASITSYKLYVNGAYNGVTATSTATSITVTGLTNGQSTFFYLTAVNIMGESIASNTVSAWPADVPSAPSNVAVEQTSDGAAYVSYTASSSNGGAEINWYQLYVNGNPTSFNSSATSATPIYVTGLSYGQTYSISVAAVNNAGTSSLATAVSFSPVIAPSSPRNVTATNYENQQVTLSFVAPISNGGTAIIKYKVYVNGAASSFMLMGFQAGSITVTGLTNGQSYFFALSAINSFGESLVSDAITATPATVPDAPANLQAQVMTDATVLVNFSTPVSNGGSAIKLFKLLINGQESSVTAAGPVASLMIVSSLTKGVAVSLSVVATNNAGQSSASNVATVTPATKPSAPADVSVDGNIGEMVLTFRPPVDNGGLAISSYKVYVENVLASALYIYNTGSIQAIVTGLTNGKEYFAYITASNSLGEGPISSIISVIPGEVPDAPTQVQASGFQDQTVTVSFASSANNGGVAISYYVLYINNVRSRFNVTGAVSEPIVVTGLTNGVTYSFALTAVNTIGESTKSTAASATPGTIPNPPTSVSATSLQAASSSVSFDAPVDNGGFTVSSYLVTANPGGITASGSSSPVVISGLTNGVSYNITVQAINQIGKSRTSVSVIATPATVPRAPSFVQGTSYQDSISVVSFNPSSDNGGSPVVSYKVISNPGNMEVITTESPVTIAGLTNGLSYTFTVVATNAVGDSSQSQPSAAIVPATISDVPSNVVGTNYQNGKSDVSFTAPANNGGTAVTSYTVLASPGDITVVGTSSPITVTGLTNGIRYTFTVSATNAAGTSGYSLSSESIIPATIPGTVSNVRATSYENQKSTVSFTLPTSTGGLPLMYEVVSSPGDIYANGTSSPIVITGLSNGVSYFFTVVATNILGESEGISSTVKAIPATIPAVVTNVQASGGEDSQSLVSFTAPTSNGGAKIIEYVVTSLPHNITASGPRSPILISGLSNNVSYTFVVQARNVVGYSVVSAVSNIVVPQEFILDLIDPTIPTNILYPNGNSVINTDECSVSSGMCSYNGSSNYVRRNFTYSSDTGKFSGIMVTNLCSYNPYGFDQNDDFIDGFGASFASCVQQLFPSYTTGPAPLRGAVGYTLHGEYIYGPLEAGFSKGQACTNNLGVCEAGLDLATCEDKLMLECGVTNIKQGMMLDYCGGHATSYHHHKDLVCDYSLTDDGHSALVGFALDGYGIYGRFEDTQTLPTDLDACGGHWGPVPGATIGDDVYDAATYVYHYHTQTEAPYFLGCFGPVTSLDQCKSMYSTCGQGFVNVSTITGCNVAYDTDCPCFSMGTEKYNQVTPDGCLNDTEYSQLFGGNSISSSSTNILVVPSSSTGPAGSSSLPPSSSTGESTTQPSPSSSTGTSDSTNTNTDSQSVASSSSIDSSAASSTSSTGSSGSTNPNQSVASSSSTGSSESTNTDSQSVASSSSTSSSVATSTSSSSSSESTNADSQSTASSSSTGSSDSTSPSDTSSSSSAGSSDPIQSTASSSSTSSGSLSSTSSTGTTSVAGTISASTTTTSTSTGNSVLSSTASSAGTESSQNNALTNSTITACVADAQTMNYSPYLYQTKLVNGTFEIMMALPQSFKDTTFTFSRSNSNCVANGAWQAVDTSTSAEIAALAQQCFTVVKRVVSWDNLFHECGPTRKLTEDTVTIRFQVEVDSDQQLIADSDADDLTVDASRDITNSLSFSVEFPRQATVLTSSISFTNTLPDGRVPGQAVMGNVFTNTSLSTPEASTVDVQIITVLTYPNYLAVATMISSPTDTIGAITLQSSACDATPGAKCIQKWIMHVSLTALRCNFNGDYSMIFDLACQSNYNGNCPAANMTASAHLSTSTHCPTVTTVDLDANMVTYPDSTFTHPTSTYLLRKFVYGRVTTHSDAVTIVGTSIQNLYMKQHGYDDIPLIMNGQATYNGTEAKCELITSAVATQAKFACRLTPSQIVLAASSSSTITFQALLAVDFAHTSGNNMMLGSSHKLVHERKTLVTTFHAAPLRNSHAMKSTQSKQAKAVAIVRVIEPEVDSSSQVQNDDSLAEISDTVSAAAPQLSFSVLISCIFVLFHFAGIFLMM